MRSTPSRSHALVGLPEPANSALVELAALAIDRPAMIMSPSTTPTSRRVVVIGAGLGGLSAACHLAGGGVTRSRCSNVGAAPGGRAGKLELGGYRFDTGPTC